MIHAEETVFSWFSHDEMGVRPHGSAHLPAPSLQMSCEVVDKQTADPCWVLRVVGGVDARTSDELLAKIERLLEANQLSRLILDLEGVARMDSSGIGALLAGLRDSENQHVRLTLCGLRKSLRDMLERMRLASLFEIRPTVEEVLCRS